MLKNSIKYWQILQNQGKKYICELFILLAYLLDICIPLTKNALISKLYKTLAKKKAVDY